MAAKKRAVTKLIDVAEETDRKELHWIAGKRCELEVYRVPLSHLYFNIENGRYADRMIRLRAENKGVNIDPRDDQWAKEIEKMLAGEHRDTQQDVQAFERLKSDIAEREQLRPGVTQYDGGVVDGNRRLCVLRRLNEQHPRTRRYGYFETVILPKNTGAEDLWKIEAGLQLGRDERWNYSPVNELLKIRQGIELFKQQIAQKRLRGKTPVQLVSDAIPGRSVAEIQEMADRLELIEHYLRFIKKPGQYDEVGRQSEDFKEATRIVAAAKNQQWEQKRLAKLRTVLFFLIHKDQMNNWELRKIYDAMGGDPSRRGRKPQANLKALEAFLTQYDEPRVLRAEVTGEPLPPPPKTKTKKGTAKKKVRPPRSSSGGDGKGTQTSRSANAVDKFLETMEASKKNKPPLQLAERARVNVEALAKSLERKEAQRILDDDVRQREAVLEAVEAIGDLQNHCLDLLRGRKTKRRKATPKRRKVAKR